MSKAIAILMDRPIAYHPILAKVLGGVKQALFLSQILYWTPRATLPDDWIRKDAIEFEDETGMSRREQNTARDALVEMGILEHKVKGVPATSHYKINMDELERVLPDGLIQFEQKRQTSLHKKAKQVSTKEPNLNETETTTETTTETPAIAVAKPELFPIASALAKVCKMDIVANRGQLFREAKLLIGATPTPTPELIEQHYNGNPGAFWRAMDWRGQKGQVPRPSYIRETWGQWANGAAPTTTPARDRIPVNNRKTGGWISTPANYSAPEKTK